MWGGSSRRFDSHQVSLRCAQTNEVKVNSIFSSEEANQRWNTIVEPGHKVTETSFSRFYDVYRSGRNVLNCAVPVARARQLTDFPMPVDRSLDKCLVASGIGNFPPGLADWKYTPRIKPEVQLPQMSRLTPEQLTLMLSPWFQSPAQAAGMCLNARHLRYHYQLWTDLQPQKLRGLHTTLVFVTPQIGFALTPHIQLQKAFRFFTSLSRFAGPAQLFPAKYIYPGAKLGELADAPAPIFADILPYTGGVDFPVMDCTPDPWGVLAYFDQTDQHYGYPFAHMKDSANDFALTDIEPGAMLLPNGQRVRAKKSESYVYATLDEKLREELKRNRDSFERVRCLARGTVTHDGLPFQLPVEMQTMVFAVILTHWEMTLDKPGDLSSYSIKTQHAAIRGFNYYQRVEPFYTNFMRMIQELSKDPDFKTYPISTHLTNSWLGGNLRVSNQPSPSEKEIGADLMRFYYQQQLDWMAGIMNLWNHVSFRNGKGLERTLSQDGLEFHQMHRMLRFDSHLFQRPLRRVSPWPNLHEGWLELDRTCQANSLPRI